MLNETDLLHLVELKEDIFNLDIEELETRRHLYSDLLDDIIKGVRENESD